MTKLTPIERAIAGEHDDRRRRWDERMIEAGFKRVNLWVPAEHVPIIKELKAQLVHGTPENFEELRDFVTLNYRCMLEDPECDEVDREVARAALRELSASPAPSGAREGDADAPTDSANERS
jgi:hypothetical protein